MSVEELLIQLVTPDEITQVVEDIHRIAHALERIANLQSAALREATS